MIFPLPPADSAMLLITLTSDARINRDGFYFDDLKISVLDTTAPGIGEKGNEEIFLSGPFPNPASGLTRFSYSMPGNGPVRLIISDIQGRIVREFYRESNSGDFIFGTWNMAPGIYACRIVSAGRFSVARKLVVIR